MDDKLDYFIDQTNTRLERLEHKIDALIGFRFMLIGMAAAVSFLTTLLFKFI